MKAPHFVIFAAIPDSDPPEHMTWAAAMVPSGPGTHWMATAGTPEDAAAKLMAMWEKQFGAPDKRKGPRKPATASVAPAPQCVDDDVIL